MTDKIKELEEQLAQARSEVAKKEGFTVVVFDDTEELKEIKVQAHELLENEKAEIMKAAGILGENMEEIKELSEKLDLVGSWLALLTIIEYPIKRIIGTIFNLDTEKIATLPNLDVLSLIFEDNPWIDSNAGKVVKELEYISNKQD